MTFDSRLKQAFNKHKIPLLSLPVIKSKKELLKTANGRIKFPIRMLSDIKDAPVEYVIEAIYPFPESLDKGFRMLEHETNANKEKFVGVMIEPYSKIYRHIWTIINDSDFGLVLQVKRFGSSEHISLFDFSPADLSTVKAYFPELSGSVAFMKKLVSAFNTLNKKQCSVRTRFMSGKIFVEAARCAI